MSCSELTRETIGRRHARGWELSEWDGERRAGVTAANLGSRLAAVEYVLQYRVTAPSETRLTLVQPCNSSPGEAGGRYTDLLESLLTKAVENLSETIPPPAGGWQRLHNSSRASVTMRGFVSRLLISGCLP